MQAPTACSTLLPLCLPFTQILIVSKLILLPGMLLTRSNYERKAHHERRQKSAPFSVSQLSRPPHHVFPKPGAVPSAKCTGKHILWPAVIWSWHTDCGWIRNQPIGPRTMWSLVRPQERSLPLAPLPLPYSAFRRAGCQESFCNMPCLIFSH